MGIMTRPWRLPVVAALLAAGLFSPRLEAASVVITFDDLVDGTSAPFTLGGAVEFVGDAVVTASFPGYPPVSADNVIFVANDDTSAELRINAVGSFWSLAGGYITATSNITLTAYASDDSVIGSSTTISTPNVGDDGTQNEYIEVLAGAGQSIAYVIFKDHGNEFTVDNFMYGPALVTVPLPAALPMMAVVLAGAGFAGWRQGRRRR